MREYTLPLAFTRQMQRLLGVEFEAFADVLHTSPPVSLRVNPKKLAMPPGAHRVPWCSTGHYLNERPVFTLDPLLHGGAYYVQEASSMFLEQVICQTGSHEKPLRVLDLCAAPGGKATHLLSLLHPQSLVVANEVIGSRVSVLRENITKWGHANVVITSNDPAHFQRLPGYFDVILVDAPCSGEGLFRKDKNAWHEWSPDGVQLCSRRQQRILSDVWPALKENGLLIYSTCTYNDAENEANLAWLSDNHTVENAAIKTDQSWRIQHTFAKGISACRFYPHRVQGEGLFMAAVRKREPQPEATFRHKEKLKSGDLNRLTEVSGWISSPERFSYLELSDQLHLVDTLHLDDMLRLHQHLNVVQAGTALFTRKQNKAVPAHAAALSVHLNDAALPGLEVSQEEALRYLRKETLTLTNIPVGFQRVTCNRVTLGWVNGLGNRINNLYPPNWRIRMQAQGAERHFE
jgi:16S rRNA C967 or C1407 C5-methylase (RsmB/RsmF family)/NOL1/NOP2/fmu family ribosome biogenesis protein